MNNDKINVSFNCKKKKKIYPGVDFFIFILFGINFLNLRGGVSVIKFGKYSAFLFKYWLFAILSLLSPLELQLDFLTLPFMSLYPYFYTCCGKCCVASE